MNRKVINSISMGVWVSALTITILAINTRWINPPTRIVTVDIISVVKEKVVQTANSTSEKSSKEHRRSMVKKVNRDLEWALKTIAQQNNVIIVPKQVVLAGSAEDVTDIVRRALGLTARNSTMSFRLSER